MHLDDLIREAHPVSLDPGTPVGAIRLTSGTPVEPVVGALVEYFGTFRDRTAVRLVVDDEDVGYLERSDAYRHVPAANRGLGGSGYSALPGLAIGASAASWITLWCPVADCPESPVYAATYDEADPLTCRIHRGQVLTPAR